MPMMTTLLTFIRLLPVHGLIEHLVNDLTGCQVAFETHLPGGAEDTTHGTTRLG